MLLTIGSLALFTSHALAFDCAKASTPVEKAICASPKAMSANNKMEKAYFSLRFKSNPAGKKALLKSQRGWLAFRNHTCKIDANCLASESSGRADVLAQIPTGTVPIFIWQKGNKTRYEITIVGEIFANAKTRGQKAYNNAVKAIIAKAPINKKTDEQGAGAWDHSINFTLKRNSKNLISGIVGWSDYSGGAHPNSWSAGLNFDQKTGKPISLKTLFDKSTRKKLFSSCANQIAARKKENGAADTLPIAKKQLLEEYREVIIKAMRESKKWNFNKQGAEVTFDAYAVGSYAEGGYDCSFSNEQLKKLSTNPTFFKN